jgi:hypothetical protein
MSICVGAAVHPVINIVDIPGFHFLLKITVGFRIVFVRLAKSGNVEKIV